MSSFLGIHDPTLSRFLMVCDFNDADAIDTRSDSQHARKKIFRTLRKSNKTRVKSR